MAFLISSEDLTKHYFSSKFELKYVSRFWISTLHVKVERVKKPLGRLWEKEEEEEYEDSGISSLDTDSQASQ